MNNYIGKVKVDKKVNWVSKEKRNIPELIEGNPYFVSFGSNVAYPCKLIKIINEFERTEVEIEIPMKPQSKRGFTDLNGNVSHEWKSTNILYANEIGISPEDAVKNTVGFGS